MTDASEIDELIKPFIEHFDYYAPRALKIKDKSGAIRPLTLNRAQIYLHDQIERQRRATGKVRVLALKGRQQGISTYCEGRGYWRTSLVFGQKALILTHLQEATDNLFGMTKRYHENCLEVLKPRTRNDSAKALTFSDLDSEFTVSTAGSKDTGRSATIQFFHGSEMAFWPNAADHMAGVGQTVPNQSGTEIILESTANGIGNLFHEMWQDAERGIGDYIAVFVPWMWQDEYSLPAPADWTPTANDVDYGEAYRLTRDQMLWRRTKIDTDFRGDEALFDQEYPATAALAFRRVKGNVRIKPEWVEKARKRTNVEPLGPKIMGIDVAESNEVGADDTVFILRQGRVVTKRERFHGKDPMEVVGLASRRIKDWGADIVNVDVTGIGSGVASRLLELGYSQVNRINFGARAIEQERYMRRRDEMWGEMAQWFQEEDPQIPDDDVMAVDLCGITFDYDSSRREILEGKKAMKKRGLKSPDDGDATALTFAVIVAPTLADNKVDHNRHTSWRR